MHTETSTAQHADTAVTSESRLVGSAERHGFKLKTWMRRDIFNKKPRGPAPKASKKPRGGRKSK